MSFLPLIDAKQIGIVLEKQINGKLLPNLNFQSEDTVSHQGLADTCF